MKQREVQDVDRFGGTDALNAPLAVPYTGHGRFRDLYVAQMADLIGADAALAYYLPTKPQPKRRRHRRSHGHRGRQARIA